MNRSILLRLHCYKNPPTNRPEAVATVNMYCMTCIHQTTGFTCRLNMADSVRTINTLGRRSERSIFHRIRRFTLSDFWTFSMLLDVFDETAHRYRTKSDYAGPSDEIWKLSSKVKQLPRDNEWSLYSDFNVLNNAFRRGSNDNTKRELWFIASTFSENAQGYKKKGQSSSLFISCCFIVYLRVSKARSDYLSCRCLHGTGVSTACRPVRRGWGRGEGAGCANAPPTWANYFKIMQIFTRNWVYTPNFGLKIRIFLRFAPPS